MQRTFRFEWLGDPVGETCSMYPLVNNNSIIQHHHPPYRTSHRVSLAATFCTSLLYQIHECLTSHPSSVKRWALMNGVKVERDHSGSYRRLILKRQV